MRGKNNSSTRQKLIANYVGSLGYYLWYFAWVLLIVQLLLRASQYIVYGQLLPPQAANEVISDPSSSNPSGVSWFALLLCGILALVCVVLLPYYIGRLSRRLPRVVLSETSWRPTLKNILRVKIVACLVVIAIAVVSVFVPQGASGSNLGFIVVVASATIATAAFSLQHQLATLWHIPERWLF